MTTELYLVRHGETDWNQQRRIQGLTDIPLNDTGREQARATGRLLARRRWDAVFSSPLRRALETAEIIAEELGLPAPATVDALVERNYGDAEGMNFLDIERKYPDRGSVPGQESREEVVARVLPALHELAAAHPDQRLVVVSHGGAIRAVLTAVDPHYTHGMITNGSVHSFEFGDDVLKLIEFDDPIAVDSLDEQNAVEAREEGLA
ncbi:MAG TPA: histidine phosphatase family protein [Pseudolysinimonas sp.]|nr:histidine phosphatase family protein [Pseudolysinimonas sp.]